MSNPTASLRDLYSTPPDIWSFPPGAGSNVTEVSLSPQWPAHNSQPRHPLFDLAAQHQDEAGPHVSVALKGILATAMLQYSTAAVAMPWEVGKLLLQIQYMPRMADSRHTPPEQEDPILSDDPNMDSDSSADSYFHDPASHGAHSSTPRRSATKRASVKEVNRARQARRRQSSSSPKATEEYIIPLGPSDGVWSMMRRVRRFRGEGWSSLWKGLLTATVTDAMTSVIQPVMHNLLLSALPVASITSPFLIPVVSHLATGILLSPLDLVRTRLIAQSSLKQRRAYTGPINALSDILREEGGFGGVYFHPHLLLPAILDNSLRPLLALALPAFLGRLFGVGDDINPVVWSVIEFVAGCASLLITLPVETIRRRLQIQVRGNAKPLHVCVNTRSQPYKGLLDAFWSVVSEETSTSSSVETESHDNAQGTWRHMTGWSQLYRGFSMGVGAGSIVMILSILGGGKQMDNGWAEL